ncbi:hypothetical protein CEXT_176791 [Caerostris extrusa]|uniref:Uncharacterized protein n=1 Tax=Caerostris extrusa TaxID=172846 RepID=A0AAV4MTF0_CAEEX|nr:hypothetical protein CEXT_176791 [Caerostris extrusa]
MDNVTSDTLPFNYTLQLTCDGGLRISGIETATCGSEDGKSPECSVSSLPYFTELCERVAGCPNPLKTKDPELLVEPDKDFLQILRVCHVCLQSGYVLSSK